MDRLPAKSASAEPGESSGHAAAPEPARDGKAPPCLREAAPAPTATQAGGAAVRIRDALPADAEAVAVLARELGYPTEPAAAAERLSALAYRRDERFRLAVGEGGVVLGWCSLEAVRRVYSEPYLEVNGLVVTEAARGRGLGAALMADAESLARALGLPLVRLRSNIIREDAHRFYDRLGYARGKTQLSFSKRMD